MEDRLAVGDLVFTELETKSLFSERSRHTISEGSGNYIIIVDKTGKAAVSHPMDPKERPSLSVDVSNVGRPVARKNLRLRHRTSKFRNPDCSGERVMFQKAARIGTESIYSSPSNYGIDSARAFSNYSRIVRANTQQPWLLASPI